MSTGRIEGDKPIIGQMYDDSRIGFSLYLKSLRAIQRNICSMRQHPGLLLIVTHSRSRTARGGGTGSADSARLPGLRRRFLQKAQLHRPQQCQRSRAPRLGRLGEAEVVVAQPHLGGDDQSARLVRGLTVVLNSPANTRQ